MDWFLSQEKVGSFLDDKLIAHNLDRIRYNYFSMMKRFVIVILFLSLLGTPGQVVFARGVNASGSPQEQYTIPLPLCLPGMPNDGYCLFYGPAQTVEEIREGGIPYPIRELPASHPSSDLGKMPIYIAKINYPDDQPAPIYGTFEDAVAKKNPISYIAPGTLRYVSYVDWQAHNGNPYLLLSRGGWMRASPAAYTDFQGLEFYQNPSNDFGWVVNETPAYKEPSYNAETTGDLLRREEIIQVYNQVEAEGAIWYQIAPDKWVDSTKTKIVSFNPIPPDGVDSDRWIEINLFQQTMAVYEDGQLLYASLVTSGVTPLYTRPGLFQIYKKIPLETMQGATAEDRSDFYYLQDVPWTMYFDEARALHAAYWRTHFGYPASHGCVNLSPTDANWLYHWADEGDFVWVHDPSGETPTDPDLYGPGAP